jgi:hypothetical protein
VSSLWRQHYWPHTEVQCNMLLNNEFKFLHTFGFVLQQLPVEVQRDGSVNAGVGWFKVGWPRIHCTYHTTWHHIPEDCNINIHCHENTRYSVILLFWLYNGTLGCILMFRSRGQSSIRWIKYYYFRYSALGSVWAETRVQSGDWYGSATLHPGQVLRGNLPLLSPTF